jgi:hypothetical protein
VKRVPVALVLLVFWHTLAMTSRASVQTSTASGRPVLVVQSTPGGAQVCVDDELLGTTSPQGRLRIPVCKRPTILKRKTQR